MAESTDSVLMAAIQEMQVLQARMDKGKALMSELQQRYDVLRLTVIPDQMAEMDTRSLKGDWGRCTLTADLNVKVENRDGLHEWLHDNDSADLIVPQVNAQTLKAWVKEQRAKSPILALPDSLDGILTVKPFTRAVLYKS